MANSSSALSYALLGRRWATISASFATLLVVLGVLHYDGVVAITVFCVACFLAWLGFFMQHRNVRAARAMQPDGER